MAKKIAINGMGRIGRATLKILFDRDDLELVAVNDTRSSQYLGNLLTDNADGRLFEKVTAGEDYIEVNGRIIRKYNEKNPDKLPWKKDKIDLVFECTGLITERGDLEKHLQAGAGHVILSSSGRENDIMTVIYGANSADVSEKVLSCGSGSANCISPIMEIIDRRLGIKKAMMTTARPCSDAESAISQQSTERSFPENNEVENDFEITKVLPELGGLYDGVIFNGPAPKGFAADIVICSLTPTNRDEVNAILCEEAQTERYCNVLGVSQSPVMQEVIKMDPRASIVDLNMTRVVGGDLIKIVSWYDNEWGVSHQMVRTAQQLLNV